MRCRWRKAYRPRALQYLQYTPPASLRRDPKPSHRYLHRQPLSLRASMAAIRKQCALCGLANVCHRKDGSPYAAHMEVCGAPTKGAQTPPPQSQPQSQPPSQSPETPKRATRATGQPKLQPQPKPQAQPQPQPQPRPQALDAGAASRLKDLERREKELEKREAKREADKRDADMAKAVNKAVKEAVRDALKAEEDKRAADIAKAVRTAVKDVVSNKAVGAAKSVSRAPSARATTSSARAASSSTRWRKGDLIFVNDRWAKVHGVTQTGKPELRCFCRLKPTIRTVNEHGEFVRHPDCKR